MTEAEWVVSDDPRRMLRCLKHWFFVSSGVPVHRRSPGLLMWPANRKFRLFTCACCRQVWHLLIDKRSRLAVKVAERFADDDAVWKRVARAVAYDDAIECSYRDRDQIAAMRVAYITCMARHDDLSSEDVIRLLSGILQPMVTADLLREVVGNPFCPVTFKILVDDKLKLLPKRMVRVCRPDEEADLMASADQHGINVVWARSPTRPWGGTPDVYGAEPIPYLTNTVLSLARAAYEKRVSQQGSHHTNAHYLDPVRLVILADALEEAGCDSTLLLRHLREHQLHVRGCWALDLILGKE